jgi:predicted nucleic acid-binding protein
MRPQFWIPVKGTLAFAIIAKQRGLIPSAADMIRQLQQQDYRIQETIVRDALARTVGEVW